MHDITLVVETPWDPERWKTIGDMLGIAVSSAAALRIAIRPCRMEHGLPLATWLHRLAHVLHHCLPTPYFPPNPSDTEPYEDLYDLPLVALNASHSAWHLTLDLRMQPEVTNLGVLPTMLLAELIAVLGGGDDATLAKREWIMQLYERGGIAIQLPATTLHHHHALMEAVLRSTRAMLSAVAEEDVLCPVILRMALEYGMPVPAQGVAERIAGDVVRTVLHNLSAASTPIVRRG